MIYLRIDPFPSPNPKTMPSRKLETQVFFCFCFFSTRISTYKIQGKHSIRHGRSQIPWPLLKHNLPRPHIHARGVQPSSQSITGLEKRNLEVWSTSREVVCTDQASDAAAKDGNRGTMKGAGGKSGIVPLMKASSATC